jgi:hypothetical protein
MTANGNGVNGVYLVNSAVGSTAEINLKGTNVANNNSLAGFQLAGRGAITLNNMTAKSNAGDGLNVHNASASPVKDVKLTGTNVFTANGFGNLVIESAGAIAVNSVTANASLNGRGATLLNTATDGKAVTITGTNYFNDNFSDGLFIQSRGVITTNNISANRNGDLLEDGAYIDNEGAAPATPRAVMMTGTNLFIDNDGQGLEVLSDGAVTISNVHAHYNDLDGTLVTNNTGTATVTVSGMNYFRHNLGAGLEINSAGAVTVNKTTAEDNGVDGLSVNSSNASITLMCGTFTNNGFPTAGWGVEVSTTAIFKRVGVFASGNNSGNIGFIGGGTQVIVRNCP